MAIHEQGSLKKKWTENCWHLIQILNVSMLVDLHNIAINHIMVAPKITVVSSLLRTHDLQVATK